MKYIQRPNTLTVNVEGMPDVIEGDLTSSMFDTTQNWFRGGRVVSIYFL